MRMKVSVATPFYVLMACLFCSQKVLAQPSVESTNFVDQWINPTDTIEIDLDRPPTPDEGELRILINNTDVTSLLDPTSEQKIRITPKLSPLPVGENELVIYLAKGADEWEEVDRFTLQVLTEGGFEVAEIEPRLDVNNKGQWEEGHSVDSGDPDRTTFQDLTGQGGLSTRHKRGDLEIRSSVNLVGSNVQEEALNFDQKGVEAPKVDLADYLVEVENGRSSFSVGSVEYGTNPVMLDSLNHRGAVLRHSFGNRFDLSLSNQSGRSIVGFDQFIGGASSSSRISAVTAGLEAIKSRPGTLRLEMMYMDGRRENETSFRLGDVPDSEKSRGWGARLVGNAFSGRLRGDVSYGRSTYENPDDPILSQGAALVSVEKTTDDARHVSLAFDFLQDYELTESQFTTVTLELTHDRNDPFYRSLGAFINSDVQLNQGVLFAQIGDFANIQLLHSDSEDNLDDIATILKTDTKRSSANVGIPLRAWFGDPEEEGSFWPTFNYAFERVHQIAANSPDEDLSGFNGGSHLPDQVSLLHDAEVQWFFDRFDFGYRFSFSDQDNRQTGRETADFRNYGHTVLIGLRLLDGLSIGFDVGRERNDDIGNNLRGYTDTGGVDLTWQFLEYWALTGSYALSRVHDSKDDADDRDFAAFAQLSRNFELPFGDYRLPGQIFVSYSQTELDSQNNLFGVNTLVKNWSINSGLSLSFF